MTYFPNLILFLGTVATVSLTGVMMPGPVTAITVTKGAQHKAAGALIAVGHGVIELPVIALIYLGFTCLLVMPEVKMSVGIAGGIVLIWMAVCIFGSMGVVALGVTHWFCDLGWLYFISWLVFRSKQMWTERVHRLVFGAYAVVLIGFGSWFIFSSVSLAVAS